MLNDNDFSPRLWLEGYNNYKTDLSEQSKSYKSKKFKINKQLKKQLQQLATKEKNSWETCINASWAILLSIYSSADTINYLLGELRKDKSKDISITVPARSIKISIDKKTTVDSIEKKINTQLSKKPSTHKKGILSRYLLLYDSDKKGNKAQKTSILPIDHSLILVLNKNKISDITFHYSDIFNNESIQLLFDHLEKILEIVISNTSTPIYNLDFLISEEKEKILNVWSKPKYSFENDNFILLQDAFTRIAKAKPNNLALKNGKNSISYCQLDNASNHLANKLINAGVKPNDVVCVLLNRGTSIINCMLAIFKCGATYVPINPKFPAERIQHILQDTNSKCILVDDIDRIPKKFHAYSFQISQDFFPTQSDKVENLKSAKITSPESIAYIIYTSGTTGTPKGVKIKHKSLSNLNKWYQFFFKINEKDRSLQFASQGFDSFICETMPFLVVGGSIHIVDDHTKLSPPLFLSWIRDENITVCDLPTAYAKILFLLDWPKKLSLRLLKIGGEIMPNYLTQSFSFDIWNGYGPTETTVETTYYQLYSANQVPSKHPDFDKPPIGKPIAGTEAYIVNSHLQLVPIGGAGELLIGGNGISPGYVNLDELTKEKFIPNTYTDSKGMLYRTGDLARWLPDGNLEFIGRLDHQIKIRGYRIELPEIETSLSQYPDVGDVAVITREDINSEKKIIAYIKPNLDKERFLFQDRCLIGINTSKYIEAVTEDISKEGVAITGITETLRFGQKVIIQLKLPGIGESKLLTAHLIWQQENRSGFMFDLSKEDQSLVNKSINYYLTCHNVMELVLSASAKRSLRKALSKKLPDYMIPTMFVTLMEFPLTYSGKIDLAALPPPKNFETKLQNKHVDAKTHTEKKMLKIWSKVLNNKNISTTDNFFDIGGSSLSAAELSIKILENFNISMPTKVLFDLPYIPILSEYIDSKGKYYTENSFVQEEIEHDCQLNENIMPSGIHSTSVKNPENILLTGAGGFLGVYLLRELLKNSNAKIYCLIRVGQFQSAAKRLASTIDKFNLSSDVSLDNRRIIAIPGDISFENFGLPLDQYTNMAEKIDLIFHCGAQVNIMAAYTHLRDSNVQGTIEVIKFATKSVDKPIHYISTLSSAVMKDDNGFLTEEFPDNNYKNLFGGYAISKWVSERLLTQLNYRKLPITIYRSGYISGQTDSGIINLNDALFMLIKGCIQLGYAPIMNEKTTILPVDFVSKIITKIALDHPDGSGVYHVDHPSGILWCDLISWLNNYGYIIKMISISSWKKKLLTIDKDNALYPFLPYYLSLDDNYVPDQVDVSKTVEKVRKFNESFPEVNSELLNTYFNYLCEIDFIPRPGKKIDA